MKLIDLALVALVIGAFIGVYRLFAADMRRGTTPCGMTTAQGGTGEEAAGTGHESVQSSPPGQTLVDTISRQVSGWLDKLLPNSRITLFPRLGNEPASWREEAEQSDAFDAAPSPSALRKRVEPPAVARPPTGDGLVRPKAEEENTSAAPQPADAAGNAGTILLPPVTPSPAPTRWRYIIIHHSGTTRGNAAIFDRYHRKERKLADGLIYHFVIGNGTASADGEIEEGPRWRKGIAGPQTRNKGINDSAIGICLVGNFEETAPSEAQMKSLHALIQHLCATYSISPKNVLPRSSVPGERTSSPGRNFRMK